MAPSPTSDVTSLGAAELVRLIQAGEMGSLELLDAYLKQVDARNPDVNALVLVDVERARRAARAFDNRREQGSDLPLGGLPVSVKDSIEVAGWPTTSGVRRLAGRVSERDAIAVERLREAGAILFAKSNLPPYAGEYQTFNKVFGLTRNPWDLSRTVGGSSGGAAAAVAACMTGLELGSDISASLRNPAHFCGVYAHKPSYGVVPFLGHIPGEPGSQVPVDGATLGPVARSAEDLLVTLRAIAGPYGEAERGWTLRLPASRGERLADFRAALYLQDDFCPVAEEVIEAIESWARGLRAEGAHIQQVQAPPVPLGEAAALADALVGAALSPSARDDLFQLACDNDHVEPRPDKHGALGTAAYLAMRHRDWLARNEERERQRRAWDRFFQSYDVLLLPVMPVVAFPHNLDGDRFARLFNPTIPVGDRSLSHFEAVRWCNAVGTAYLPVTVVPVGAARSGLPVGVQVVGRYLDDLTTLGFATAAEMVMGPPSLPAETR